ncbi:MAG TPA: DUF4845 domain-containing protein [Rhodocyclaceae bacterium]|nr:DUF4845 domain-containing protein [Rhodocyclaceae bacterium]
MKRQRGLTLLSTLIVGALVMAVLILGLKCVPVFNEYFAIKKAFNEVVQSVDPGSPPSTFRSAFQKHADVDDIESLDAQSIVVTKENGKAFLSADYRRYVKLFANVSLVFDFSVATDGAPDA